MKRVCPACREISELLVLLVFTGKGLVPFAFLCPRCEHRWNILSPINAVNTVCEN